MSSVGSQSDSHLHPFSLRRAFQAVEDVRNRLLRATKLLDTAGIDYAVIGGNAVAAWVSRIDKAAIRATQAVDLLLRRGDLDAARVALEASGFQYAVTLDVTMFIDGPDGNARDAVHILFANEKVREEYAEPTPDVSDSEQAESYRVVSLPALLKLKLTSFRRKDQVHIQDMIQVGLIDQSWTDQFNEPLKSRLQELIDDPYG